MTTSSHSVPPSPPGPSPCPTFSTGRPSPPDSRPLKADRFPCGAADHVPTLDFVLAGVGGQGILLASDILAQVGLCAGYSVKKSEVHGMAQRGGSVTSHVRWGQCVYSPLIGIAGADILVALERLEALRHVEMLRPGGKMLVNDHAIIPVTVTAGNFVYPSHEQILSALRQVTSEITFIPAVAIAEQLGNARAHNVVILGALSSWLNAGLRMGIVSEDLWKDVIRDRVPPRYVELNLEAFSRGREWAHGERGLPMPSR